MSHPSNNLLASSHSASDTSSQGHPNKEVQIKQQRPKSRSLQPCTCDVAGCGKRFSKQSNLRAHLRVHNGTLPYSCVFDGCSKRFRWKSSLRPHIRVHLACGHALPLNTASQWAVRIAKEELENLDSRRLKRCLRIAIEKMGQNCVSAASEVESILNSSFPQSSIENDNSRESQWQRYSCVSQLEPDCHESLGSGTMNGFDIDELLKDLPKFSTKHNECPNHVYVSDLGEESSLAAASTKSQLDTEPRDENDLSPILDDFLSPSSPTLSPFSEDTNDFIDHIDNYYTRIGSTPFLFCHYENLEDAWYLPGTY